MAYGLLPQAFVGDLDSLSGDIKKKYASILIQSDDQESNDLTKAVGYCIEKGYSKATILGATGMREDHALGNISLMLEYYPRMEVQIISDFGMFFLVCSGEPVKSCIGEKVSLFSIDNRVCVTSRGLKYPLKDLQLSNWYMATLNEAREESFTLYFESEIPIIAYKAW